MYSPIVWLHYLWCLSVTRQFLSQKHHSAWKSSGRELLRTILAGNRYYFVNLHKRQRFTHTLNNLEVFTVYCSVQLHPLMSENCTKFFSITHMMIGGIKWHHINLQFTRKILQIAQVETNRWHMLPMVSKKKEGLSVNRQWALVE